MAVATSAADGWRPSRAVSWSVVWARSRALALTDRLAQSRARSSSRMAPRMREEAKRWNVTPRSGWYDLAAWARPAMPAETRSVRQTWRGMRPAISETM